MGQDESKPDDGRIDSTSVRDSSDQQTHRPTILAAIQPPTAGVNSLNERANLVSNSIDFFKDSPVNTMSDCPEVLQDTSTASEFVARPPSGKDTRGNIVDDDGGDDAVQSVESTQDELTTTKKKTINAEKSFTDENVNIPTTEEGSTLCGISHLDSKDGDFLSHLKTGELQDDKHREMSVEQSEGQTIPDCQPPPESSPCPAALHQCSGKIQSSTDTNLLDTEVKPSAGSSIEMLKSIRDSGFCEDNSTNINEGTDRLAADGSDSGQPDPGCSASVNDGNFQTPLPSISSVNVLDKGDDDLPIGGETHHCCHGDGDEGPEAIAAQKGVPQCNLMASAQCIDVVEEAS